VISEFKKSPTKDKLNDTETVAISALLMAGSPTHLDVWKKLEKVPVSEYALHVFYKRYMIQIIQATSSITVSTKMKV